MRNQLIKQLINVNNIDELKTIPQASARAGGWKDLTATVLAGKLPAANAPTLTAFQPGGSERTQQLAFSLNDRVTLEPYHVLHDISPNAVAYFHVHWTTSSTNVNSVKWDIEYSMAKGHNQQKFSTGTSITVEAAALGAGYYHMVTETTSPIYLPEPDTMIIADLKRVTNGGTDNTDTVFGLYVDLHYWSDREVTVNRTPNFYS